MGLLVANRSSSTQLWVRCLLSAGFNVDQFDDPEDASEALNVASYDLAILGCDGSLDWSAWLKRFGKPAATGFFVLVAEEEERRIAAFEAGADDCLPQCISPKEMVAKVRSILRRPRGSIEQLLQVGNIEMDCTNREVAVGGEPISVPPQELRIMELIMRRPGRIVTRQALENNLYGACMEVGPNSTEARISCLRRRLANAGADVTVQNVRGIGYKLAQVVAKAEPEQAARPMRADRLRVSA